MMGLGAMVMQTMKWSRREMDERAALSTISILIC